MSFVTDAVAMSRRKKEQDGEAAKPKTGATGSAADSGMREAPTCRCRFDPWIWLALLAVIAAPLYGCVWAVDDSDGGYYDHRDHRDYRHDRDHERGGDRDRDREWREREERR